jgi:hypothetical protein
MGRTGLFTAVPHFRPSPGGIGVEQMFGYA